MALFNCFIVNTKMRHYTVYFQKLVTLDHRLLFFPNL